LSTLKKWAASSFETSDIYYFDTPVKTSSLRGDRLTDQGMMERDIIINHKD